MVRPSFLSAQTGKIYLLNISLVHFLRCLAPRILITMSISSTNNLVSFHVSCMEDDSVLTRPVMRNIEHMNQTAP